MADYIKSNCVKYWLDIGCGSGRLLERVARKDNFVELAMGVETRQTRTYQAVDKLRRFCEKVTHSLTAFSVD